MTSEYLRELFDRIGKNEMKALSIGHHDSCNRSVCATPVRVIYNNPATIVFWSDGIKTVAKCDEEDEYDKAVGLFMAICKRYVGGGEAYADFLRFVCRELYPMNGELKVGDHFEVPLDDQIISATVQKVTDTEIICMTDDCIMKSSMNDTNINAGGYDASDLKKKIESDLLSRFPKGLQNRITYIAPPTYGQIFGHDEWYHRAIEPDNDEQFELMKKRKNLVADYKDDYSCYWLQNATKPSYSSSHFALVHGLGDAYCSYASNSYGVRVVFGIKK